MNGDQVVVIDQLTKVFGDFRAVDNVSLRLDRGRILGFVGPNGAGKTTTIKILVGQLRPTSGTATIAGANCSTETRKIKKLVGYMPDVFGSYDNMRVHEYLDFFGAAYGIGRGPRQQRISEVLDITGAEYMRDRYVESLSHGMKQRVAIARTLLHDPEVLILDEPANGLDPQARIEMRQILLDLAARGKTLIVTSHILPELSRICDIVAIMTHGKLRAFGTLDQIMREIRQRRTIEVQLLEDTQLSAAAECISQVLAGREETEVKPFPTEKMVRFDTSLPEEILRDVLAALINAGLSVTQFRELQSDLEDTFLTITKQAKAEQDAKADVLPAELVTEADDHAVADSAKKG